METGARMAAGTGAGQPARCLSEDLQAWPHVPLAAAQPRSHCDHRLPVETGHVARTPLCSLWALGRAWAEPVRGKQLSPCPHHSMQAADAPSCGGPLEATLVDLDLPAAPAGPVSAAAPRAWLGGEFVGPLLVTGHGSAVPGASRLQGPIPPGSRVG